VKVKLVKRTKSRLYLEITLRNRPNLIAEIEKSRPFYCRNNAASRMTLLACAACSPTAKAVLQVQDDAGRDVCTGFERYYAPIACGGRLARDTTALLH
jgi:hypothetical protein